jgi:hypothetical protein
LKRFYFEMPVWNYFIENPVRRSLPCLVDHAPASALVGFLRD